MVRRGGEGLYGRPPSPTGWYWNNKQEEEIGNAKNSGNSSGNNHDIRGVGELGRVRGDDDSAPGPDFELLPNSQVTK